MKTQEAVPNHLKELRKQKGNTIYIKSFPMEKKKNYHPNLVEKMEVMELG